MAMPTPNRTPASTRFDPPSPKANVSPETTMATSESPRAMVLVNAVSSTFTAFSHGEFPAAWPKAGEARKHQTPTANMGRSQKRLVSLVIAQVLPVLSRKMGKGSSRPIEGVLTSEGPAVAAGCRASCLAHLERLLRDSVVPPIARLPLERTWRDADELPEISGIQ